ALHVCLVASAEVLDCAFRGRPRPGDELRNLARILRAARTLDAARHVDAPRAHRPDRVRDVVRCQAAREDPRGPARAPGGPPPARGRTAGIASGTLSGASPPARTSAVRRGSSAAPRQSAVRPLPLTGPSNSTRGGRALVPGAAPLR